MRTIDLAQRKLTLTELLQLAAEETIILRTPEGLEFFIAEINDLDKEVELVRQHPELMALLEERSKEEKTYSIHEVREELKSKRAGFLKHALIVQHKERAKTLCASYTCLSPKKTSSA